MTPIGRFTIPAGHPALPGHFPGRPIVPGVVLLDHVLAALLATRPGRTAAALPQVKFLRPVRPGETVDILASDDPARPAFLCRVGGDDVARGIAQLDLAQRDLAQRNLAQRNLA